MDVGVTDMVVIGEKGQELVISSRIGMGRVLARWRKIKLVCCNKVRLSGVWFCNSVSQAKQSKSRWLLETYWKEKQKQSAILFVTR